uniref:Transposase n=1 Tax=Heterorhabditis bacteriophora TaxID=37862 RepID=A0A1I7XUF7_HETBA
MTRYVVEERENIHNTLPLFRNTDLPPYGYSTSVFNAFIDGYVKDEMINQSKDTRNSFPCI